MTRPRPAVSRPALILLGMGVAMFAIARMSGAGWVMVVLSGLLATLVLATAWPGLWLAAARVSVTAARDGTAGRPLSLRVEVAGWDQHLMARVVSPPGEWVRAVVPAAGETSVVPERRGVVREVVVELRGAGPLGLVWWTRKGRV